MNYNIIHQYEMLKEQEIIEQKKTEKLNQNKNNMLYNYNSFFQFYFKCLNV